MQFTKHLAAHKPGHWLPEHRKTIHKWIEQLIDEAKTHPRPLHPAVAELQHLIESDAQIFMLFHQMFEELPKEPRFLKDPTGAPQIRDYRSLLALLNLVITRAPEFDSSGMVGLPMNAILDWPMGTVAGASVFLNEKVNLALRRVLREWSRFLGSSDSLYVLTEDPDRGWFNQDAKKAMPGFEELYVCDPSAPHHGFTSWDDFFTRRLRPGVRPIAAPHDDSVIINACEAAPYRLAHDVRDRDRFWIKDQPYSVMHILADDPAARQFVGGTVYQGFLNALSYHRWHSPVRGTVVKTRLVPGTYFAQAHAEGLETTGLHDSQAYLAQVATRALIFIEADNPAIGLMCFVGIGMAEVSTCEIGVYEGQHVDKGDELGIFHYGGSTYCLLFRPSVQLSFDLHGQEPGTKSEKILINEKLAQVR
ncbi:MAG: Phosphatidylserine decarboxylase-related [Myxococcaceae bacterium]|nr:Phosphatidylserine decarboxylase-related [Myxococcaceae bacterium]